MTADKKLDEMDKKRKEIDDRLRRLSQKKAKLLKIKLAVTGGPKFPSTPEARRGLIQGTKSPSATIEGTNTQTQNRLRAENQFINKKKPIRPKGSDAKISPDLKKRLAKIKTAIGVKNFNKETEYTRASDVYKIDGPYGKKNEGQNKKQKENERRQLERYIDDGKKVKPIDNDTKINSKLKRKLASQKTAHDHGHTILMKGHEKGLYRSASLENQQGKYAKYWLLNAKQTNGNGWGIAAHSAKDNMNKFIGRPLVITSSTWHGSSVYGAKYDHPYVPTNDLNKIFEHQEQFRVGNIVDIGEKNGDYYAMIEMLPKFANMTLPPFCSPAIYQLDAREAEGQISKWEALHLAALDENPAYGARIALLKGTCVGTNHECRVQFRSAKQKEASIVCTKGLKAKLQRIALSDDAKKRMEDIGKKELSKARKKHDSQPLLKEVPFGGSSSRGRVEDFERMSAENNAGIGKTKIKPNKPTQKDRNRIIKAKLQKVAINDVREIPHARFNGDEPHVLHPKHKEIQSHAVKRLGVSKGFTGSHFLTSDGQLLGDGKTEHRTMSHNILKSFPDKKFNEMAATADAKVMSRWGTDGRNMTTLLEQTGMSRVSADATGMNIDAKHPLTKSQRTTITQHLEDNGIGPDNVFIDDDTPSQKTISKQLRLGKLKFKIASLGEHNMTYQDSKKVKIRKKKHPEVRKAKSEFNHPNIDAALRGIHSSAMPEKQSTFLSSRGDYIGGGDDHTDTIKSIFNTQYTQEDKGNDGPVTRFSAEHGLPRIQRRILRSGERISVGIHSKINSSQLRSLKDIEKSGIDLGFVVGADPMTGETGDGFRDMTKALRRNRFL